MKKLLTFMSLAILLSSDASAMNQQREDQRSGIRPRASTFGLDTVSLNRARGDTIIDAASRVVTRTLSTVAPVEMAVARIAVAAADEACGCSVEDGFYNRIFSVIRKVFFRQR